MARKSREETVVLSSSSEGEDNPKEDSITQEDALPDNQDDPCHQLQVHRLQSVVDVAGKIYRMRSWRLI